MTHELTMEIVLLSMWGGFLALAWRVGPTVTAAGPARLLRLSRGGVAVAFALQCAAMLLSSPASRSVVIGLMLAALAAWAVRRATRRSGVVAAEAAAPAHYRVRAAGPRPPSPMRSGYASASAAVRAIENMEVE